MYLPSKETLQALLTFAKEVSNQSTEDDLIVQRFQDFNRGDRRVSLKHILDNYNFPLPAKFEPLPNPMFYADDREDEIFKACRYGVVMIESVEILDDDADKRKAVYEVKFKYNGTTGYHSTTLFHQNILPFANPK